MSLAVEPVGPNKEADSDNPLAALSSDTWRDKTLLDLGWTSVLDRIAEHAMNGATATRLLATLPYPTRQEAEQAHTWVAEAIALHERDLHLPVRSTNPLEAPLATLQRGASASGADLRDVGRAIEQALSLRGHVFTHTEHCPALVAAFDVDPTLSEIARRLQAALDDNGQLYDSASDGLRSARRELGRARDALKHTQTQLLRKHKDQLAGAYFAERDGRFVLPVRTDAPRIEGTVLGSSGTGSTLYVEPVELLEANNRTRIAEAHVSQEEARLLAELSAVAAMRLTGVATAYEVCLLADRVAACATWAVRHQATPVRFAEEPVLRLVQMRHPLLLPKTRQDDALRVIASDLELLPSQALILSGPNAGGKTVALKCLGLAALLARSGLPVPCAATSQIGWFSEVLTDIGDDQSISRSLSTFSAHVTNLAHCLTVAGRGVLLLLDEVAGGTDPDEGAALAVALLEAFIGKGASVATTTHYDRLKQLGARRDGRYCNASVGFDLQRMRPTFRVTMGVPGASSALAVAERYGVPSSVIAHAKAAIPKENLEQQRLIAQLEEELDRAVTAREAHEATLAETEKRRESLEREREHVLRHDRLQLEKLAAELTKEVQTARADLRRAKALLGTGTKDAYREAELLVSGAALPITVDGALTRAIQSPQVPLRGAAPPSDLVTGMTVKLLHLNTDAVVVEPPSKGQVRVSVGGLKMSVPLEQVQLPSQKKPPPKSSGAKLGNKSKSVPRYDDAPATYADVMRTTHNTCDLRGKRVDDGLLLVDQFLDEMLRMREPAAFILHGHGTGAMKSAVREHLAASRVVRHFEAASHENGGDAFTVALLR
jgi:DNA mismatch repair protein MutS2